MKYLSGNEIKEGFISFFRDKGHHFTPSSSLIPQGDKTILFSNSGMNQFKDIFLGVKEIKEKRVCNYQKCIRLSGKHNDLEEVGWDSYHHTFFEMLGNWSFGDYYKKEAIRWAWELLTEVWQLPKDKLFATVYYQDDESFKLWKSETDIPPKNILKFNEKDNFWEMADVGPCGPCSEVHIDLGVENCTCTEAEKRKSCRQHGGGVNQDCARYIEIWNLVFIQYNRNTKGELSPLEKVHVDTGMGFERICRVMQGKQSNYETDVFLPIIKALEVKSQYSYHGDNEKTNVAFRVISDHIRTIFLSIADGVIPSNEGRGYVIRRVLRRAFRHGKILGFEKPFLSDLCEIVPKTLANHYPYLTEKLVSVKKIILYEEELFVTTLNKGLILFEKLVEKTKDLNGRKITGKDAFILYDTYGFPFDLITLLAKENQLQVEEEEFEQELNQQKEKSRKQTKLSFDSSLITGLAPTKYLDLPLASSYKLLRIIHENLTIKSSKANKKELYLVFETSEFYGESGGQIGDQGMVYSLDQKNYFKVMNTIKENKVILLYGELIEGELITGEMYYQKIDQERRREIAKNHTATHLLQQSLINHLGHQVKQSGSLINEEKLRFDFTYHQALSEEQKSQIEKEVNQKIVEGLAIKVEILEYKKALAEGARAFFDEKYEDWVRVVTFGNYSKELCGGSHVNFTSQIGGFQIVSEIGVASGIRRIEAITGKKENEFNLANQKLIKEISGLLKLNDTTKIIDRIRHLKDSLATTQEELFKNQQKVYYNAIIQNQKTINEFSFLSHSFTKETKIILENLVDSLKKNPYGIVFLINEVEDKFTYYIGVGGKVKERNIKANQLLRLVNEFTKGRGGGNPNFAQGGSSRSSSENLLANQIVEKFYRAVKNLLKNE